MKKEQRFYFKEPPSLTLWLRIWGENSYIRPQEYIRYLEKELSPFYTLKILVVTNEQDPVLKYLPAQENLEVLYADMSLISAPLNVLAKKSACHTPALILSLGTKIKNVHLMEGMKWLSMGAWLCGWEVQQMHNTGDIPGKGWYNTCALYAPQAVQLLQEKEWPHWVDPGVAGQVDIEGKKIPMGGNEELFFMQAALEKDPSAFFVLDTHAPVVLKEQTGTGKINFEDKMARKVAVSRIYLKDYLHVKAEDLWGKLLVVQSDHTVKLATEIENLKTF